MNTILIIIGAILVVIPIYVYCMGTFLYKKVFYRHDEPALDQQDIQKTHYAPYADYLVPAMKELRSIPYQRLYMTSFDGLKLCGYYFDNNSDRTAILVHGYKSNFINNFSGIGLDLIKKGYNVFFPNLRAHGESEGKIISFGEHEATDILDWIDEITKLYSPKNIILYGMSMGCHTLEMISDRFRTDNIRCMILDCGFIKGEDVVYRTFKTIPPIVFNKFFVNVISVMTKHRCGFDIRVPDSREHLKNTKVPAFFIHGEKDPLVYVQDGLANYEACASEKEKYISTEADHATAYLAGRSEGLIETIENFICRYAI